MDPEARLQAALAGVRAAEARIRAAQAEQARFIDEARVAMLELEWHPDRSEAVNREFGERSFAAELATTLRVHERTAVRLIEDAEHLVRVFPATGAALAAGEIALGHARELFAAAQSVPASAHTEFEAAALDRARRMSPPAFRRACKRLRERFHPVPAEERHEIARAERSFSIESADDGMAWVHLFLEAERAHAIRARLGADCAVPDPADARTRTQREADRAAELLLGVVSAAENETTAPLGVVRPVVHVTVPVLTLLGIDDEPAELDGYGPIDADTARHLSAHAPSFRRILTHPETGAYLSYGRTSYRVPADLAGYLRARDGTCRFPGCTRSAAGCDIDHTRAWEHGGPTADGNLAVLCRKHHRVKHHTRWQVHRTGDGGLAWTSPAGTTHVTRPARFDRPAA